MLPKPDLLIAFTISAYINVSDDIISPITNFWDKSQYKEGNYLFFQTGRLQYCY